MVRCWVWVQEGQGRPEGVRLLYPNCRAQAHRLCWVIRVTQPVAELRLGPVTWTLKHYPDFSARAQSTSLRGWLRKSLDS